MGKIEEKKISNEVQRHRRTNSKRMRLFLKRTQSNNNKFQVHETIINDSDSSIQSAWGETMPVELLYYIFQKIVTDDGTLPAIIRLGQVCKLWHKVSLTPSLWRNLDLGSRAKGTHKNEQTLLWLIENRLINCTDINLANWKIKNTLCILELLAEASPNLNGLSLAGWKRLTGNHLNYIVNTFDKLNRIDLSSINSNFCMTKTAVGLVPLTSLMEQMNERLTHLNLAYNRLLGVTQIIDALATHCPNLISLDLSNVSLIGSSAGVLYIEKLQYGCPKLKILRIVNSTVVLMTATPQEQISAPGFPDLEEPSLASSHSQFINDECIQRILRTSKNLQLLDVRCCDRLTHNCLIGLPTENLKRLFLSGCSIIRDQSLEMIAVKWAHSLIKIDLARAHVQPALDNFLRMLIEKTVKSPLSHIDLCGSSVSLEVLKEVLQKCSLLCSINLSSCRGLPRGIKRQFTGFNEIADLKRKLGVKNR